MGGAVLQTGKPKERFIFLWRQELSAADERRGEVGIARLEWSFFGLQNLQAAESSGWSLEIVGAAIEEGDNAEDASLRATSDRRGTDASKVVICLF